MLTIINRDCLVTQVPVNLIPPYEMFVWEGALYMRLNSCEPPYLEPSYVSAVRFSPQAHDVRFLPSAEVTPVDAELRYTAALKR